MAEEQVLVVARSVFESAGSFQGLAGDVQEYLQDIFAEGAASFMPRPQAEQNSAFKQIIPYVIMSCEGKYLSYVRGKRAGETRLVGCRSIGIGGHINPVDDLSLLSGDFGETYLAAVDREVAEEVAVETAHTDHVVALLNDDSNEVGQVHLGVVHHWRLETPAVTKREQMITQMGFMTLAELRDARDSLETWSSLCLDYLETMDADAGVPVGNLFSA